MKIIDYETKYDEDLKNLLLELQEYIASIDKEGYNVVGKDYKEKYFLKIMQDYKQYEGKIFLAEDNDQIIGAIIGVLNNYETDSYDFKAPKRGRVLDLIVKKEYRGRLVGQKLLAKMEQYFKSVGCKALILGVFGYNDKAINFYTKNGYTLRTMDIMKKL